MFNFVKVSQDWPIVFLNDHSISCQKFGEIATLLELLKGTGTCFQNWKALLYNNVMAAVNYCPKLGPFLPIIWSYFQQNWTLADICCQWKEFFERKWKELTFLIFLVLGHDIPVGYKQSEVSEKMKRK